MAKEFGVSQSVVSKIKLAGLTKKELEAISPKKVDPKDYKEIADRYKKGETVIRLAAEYGVASSAIYRAINKDFNREIQEIKDKNDRETTNSREKEIDSTDQKSGETD